MLLLTAVTFPHGLFDADSCKCTGIYSLQKLDFKTQWYTEFLTLRPLVLPLFHLGATAQGLQVIISVDPCVLKTNYFLNTYNSYWFLYALMNYCNTSSTTGSWWTVFMAFWSVSLLKYKEYTMLITMAWLFVAVHEVCAGQVHICSTILHIVLRVRLSSILHAPVL